MNPMSGLPAIPETALPADVRNGSAKDKRAYEAALGFERVMLGTLTKQLTEGSELADGPYASAVQEAFSGSLIANGGLGMGEQLYRSFKERA